MKNIVFMGSKPIGYKCLEFLLEKKNEYDINLVGLFTKQRSEFGGETDLTNLAVENDIPMYNDLDDLLKIDEAHIIISVQYHRILKSKHIEKANDIAINLHMAPLPEYRGSNQFSFAIINGDKIFGTTIHKLEESTDAGSIICEDRFNISESISVSELYDITFEKSLDLFKDNIKNIIDGKITLTKQEELVYKRSKSFHVRSEINKIKEISLVWDEEKIDRYLRATSMPGFEPPFTYIKGNKIYLMNEELYKRINEK